MLAIASVFAPTKLLGKTGFLGSSTTFVRGAGMIEQVVCPEYLAANTYFSKEKIVVDWQFMVVCGFFLGALASSLSNRGFKLESVPQVWRERFGPGIGRRALGAMLGARLADGCPSGHGLSWLMKLSASGMVAMLMFFGMGVFAAAIIYGRKSS